MVWQSQCEDRNLNAVESRVHSHIASNSARTDWFMCSKTTLRNKVFSSVQICVWKHPWKINHRDVVHVDVSLPSFYYEIYFYWWAVQLTTVWTRSTCSNSQRLNFIHTFNVDYKYNSYFIQTQDNLWLDLCLSSSGVRDDLPQGGAYRQCGQCLRSQLASSCLRFRQAALIGCGPSQLAPLCDGPRQLSPRRRRWPNQSRSLVVDHVWCNAERELGVAV